MSINYVMSVLLLVSVQKIRNVYKGFFLQWTDQKLSFDLLSPTSFPFSGRGNLLGNWIYGRGNRCLLQLIWRFSQHLLILCVLNIIITLTRPFIIAIAVTIYLTLEFNPLFINVWRKMFVIANGKIPFFKVWKLNANTGIYTLLK